MWIKSFILLMFVLVVVSLGAGFYCLLTEHGPSKKLLTSLKVRLILTLLIMVVVTTAWLHGDIHSPAPWLYR